MTAPVVAVVVPTFRRPDGIVALLRALEAQTLPPDDFEVVVVDDCSGDDTAERVAAVAASSRLHIRLLRTERNGGPAAARNVGWRATTAPIVAFTDDDCTPRPRWLESGVRLLGADDRIGVAQGRTELPAGVGRPVAPWVVYREIYEPTPWFEGCNLFFRRDALEASGGYDEQIGWWYEDTAAGWSVLTAGWERGFADDAVVVHDLEDRGLRFFIRRGRQTSTLVGIARAHPALRGTLWRPWVLRPIDGPFLLALLAATAAAAGVARPRALLLTIPYLVARRGMLRAGPSTFAGAVAIDAATAYGLVHGSVRHRTLLL